ncbi:MAG: nitroreductase [Pseudomonadota bacterium]
MPAQNPHALEFLATRRSRPAKTLSLPIPGRAELEALLTIAARTPDHGKLEPWRFVVLNHAACERLAGAVAEYGASRDMDPETITKMAQQFSMAHLVVAVVASPKASDKIPAIEQTLSAGAVCLSLLNACLAAGWGANWLSGWASHDPGFTGPHLGLQPHETVAGLVHIGTETAAPPERPRPDVAALTDWVEA